MVNISDGKRERANELILDPRVEDYADEHDLDLMEAYAEVIEAGLDELEDDD